MSRNNLPFGSEFSPSQISLPVVLQLANELGGDFHAFEDAIQERFFTEGYEETSDKNKHILAMNCKLGMKAYGIIDETATLTEFGRELLALSGDEEQLYDKLAAHILLNLHGLTVIRTAQDMHARAERVTLIKLREWLAEREVHFPSGGKHASIMRLWLEQAGVVTNTDWNVDEAKLNELLGISQEEVEAISQLPLEQKVFLKALVNLGVDETYDSSSVRAFATATYGVKYNEKNLTGTVLNPLVAAGFITINKPTRSKAPTVTATEKLKNEVFLPIMEILEADIDTELRGFLRKPLSDILVDVASADKHVKGLALEALAFYLMRLIDMKYVKTRLRGTVTGGAEVDLIFENDRLWFSRWQIQCKNTTSVSLDDVAKEVGLTFQLKSNVIVMVSTGSIGTDARAYGQNVMASTNLNIIFIDGNDLNRIKDDPLLIVDVLNREAKQAMRIKALPI